MKPVTLWEAQYVAKRVAEELFKSSEPMAHFDTRHPGKLESSLALPFSTFNKRYLYWTLPHRAAALFYFVNKNHPFANGNKRMAVVLMLVFLYKNKKWIDIPPIQLYDVATMVAQSKPAQKDDIIKALKMIIKENLTNY